MEAKKLSTGIFTHNEYIDYGSMKKTAIENQPMVITRHLADVELERNRTIKMAGKILPLTGLAYNSFLTDVLGVAPGFAEAYKNATSEKAELHMLGLLRTGLAAKKNESVNIIANPIDRSILKFSKVGSSKTQYITNETYLNIFEMIMNKYSNLKLKDMYIDKWGRLTMNVRSNIVAHYGTGEDFLGGLSFINSPIEGSVVNGNILRLVCTNGMTVTSGKGSVFSFNGDNLDKLFEMVNVMSRTDFMVPGIQNKIEKAQRTMASINEVEMGMRICEKNSTAKKETVRTYFGYNEIAHELKQKGVKIASLTAKQKPNCPANMTYWDLINKITYFGSHDLGFYANFGMIQVAAGNLFNKKKDAEGMVIFN